MPLVFYCYLAKLGADQATAHPESGLLFFARPPVQGQQVQLTPAGPLAIVVGVDHYRMTLELAPLCGEAYPQV